MSSFLGNTITDVATSGTPVNIVAPFTDGYVITSGGTNGAEVINLPDFGSYADANTLRTATFLFKTKTGGGDTIQINYNINPSGAATVVLFQAAQAVTLNCDGRFWEVLLQATDNVAIGASALTLNQTSTSVVAIGTNALSSIVNGADGSVAIGQNALASATTSDNNVAIGIDALQSSIDGSENVALGESALTSLTHGANNCAVGVNSLFRFVSGSGNCGVGGLTLQNLPSGSNNTAVGDNAAGDVNADSNTNIFIGHRAALHMTSGDNNLIFGGYDFSTGPTVTPSNILLFSDGSGNLIADFNYTTASIFTFQSAVKLQAYTFASLPTAVAGTIAYVTNSNTNTWGATIAGGGANKVLAFYNGTNWTVAGK